jgi:hypothetical protein
MGKSRQRRRKRAVKEGREVERDGRPPYLEKSEFNQFIQTIQIETAKGNNPTVEETCRIVFF